MTKYLVRRSAQMGLTLLVFLTLTFILVQAQPGDFTSFYALDPKVPLESRERIAAAFGLDQPAWRQYVSYLGNVLRGDLGVSFSHYPRSVASVLLERLPRTLLLFLPATLIAFSLGFWLGKVVAWRRGRAVEYVATLGGVYLYTVFLPWFALLLLWLFALRLGWFPVGKFLTPALWSRAPVDANAVTLLILLSAGAVGLAVVGAAALRHRARHVALAVPSGMTVAVALAWLLSGYYVWALDILWHLALPVLTLALVSFGGTMLLTRASMVETLREDYVLAARARGLDEGIVRDRYAARNALLPVVTSLVFGLAFALDGSVIAEAVFSWPGVGLTLLHAVLDQDLPLAVGAFLLTGVLALVAHLVADLLYAYLDPRVRYDR